MPREEKPERLFVKYQNNKFHEMGSAESYVSMGYLHQLIYSGEKVRVLADVNNEDITAMVMARLIYDKARSDKARGLPISFSVKALTDLIINSYKKKGKARGSRSGTQ